MDDVKAALGGMLSPERRETSLGLLEIRQIIRVPKVGNIAGCYVLSGKVTRNSKIRVVRDGVVITEDEISSLRRFKDDVKEVVTGMECGLSLVNYNDIQEGDVIETFTEIEVEQKL